MQEVKPLEFPRSDGGGLQVASSQIRSQIVSSARVLHRRLERRGDLCPLARRGQYAGPSRVRGSSRESAGASPTEFEPDVPELWAQSAFKVALREPGASQGGSRNASGTPSRLMTGL